jgi:hypothetical protein
LNIALNIALNIVLNLSLEEFIEVGSQISKRLGRTGSFLRSVCNDSNSGHCKFVLVVFLSIIFFEGEAYD